MEDKLKAMFADAEKTAKRVASNVDIAAHGAVIETFALLHRDLDNLRAIIADALGYKAEAHTETTTG